MENSTNNGNSFFSSNNSEGTCTMHTKSDNTETIIESETNEITEELFESLLQRYQKGLEESRKGSGCIYLKNMKMYVKIMIIVI